MNSFIKSYGWLILLAILVGMRLLFLEADPSFLKLFGDVSDEGWWSNIPQNKINYGEWISHQYDGGLSMAPLSTFIIYGVFLLIGANLISLKLLIASVFTVNLFLVYQLIKEEKKQLVRLTLLALSASFYLFEFSRLGHIEMISCSFILSFLWFLKQKTGSIQLFLSGVLLGLLVLSKLSFVFFLPVGVLLVLLVLMKRGAKLLKGGFTLIGILTPLLFWFFLKSSWLGGGELHMTTWITKNYLPSLLENFHPLSWMHHGGSLSSLEIFRYPEVFLLVFLTLLYFHRRRFFYFGTLGNLLQNLSYLELSMCTWILVYTPILLISDFSDRRFMPLIYPMIILSFFNLNEIRAFTDKLHVGFMTVVSGGLMLSSISIFPDYTYSILKSLMVVIPILFILEKWIWKGRSLYKGFFLLGLICFTMAIAKVGLFQVQLILKRDHLLLVLLFLPLLIWKKKRELLLSYFFALSFLCSAPYFSRLTFSIKENLADINTITNDGEWIIGQDWIMEMGVGSALRPVYHSLDDLANGAPNLTFAKDLHPKYLFWREEEGRSLTDIRQQNGLIEKALDVEVHYLKSQSWIGDSFKTHLYELESK